MKGLRRFRGPMIVLTCATIALSMGVLTGTESSRQLTAREMETVLGTACPGCALSQPSNACNQKNLSSICVDGQNPTCPTSWQWYPGIQTYVCQSAENNQKCQNGTLKGCWIGHGYNSGAAQPNMRCQFFAGTTPNPCIGTTDNTKCRQCTDSGTNGTSQDQENDTCVGC